MKKLTDLIEDIQDDSIPKSMIVDALALVVTDWLEYRTEELFSKLYRLDILEKDIRRALTQADIPKEIAALIYERQLQKSIARKNNPPPTAEEDLKW